MNRERAQFIIKCGGLHCVLDAIENHIKDLSVLEFAVPTLRLMVMDGQEECQEVLSRQRIGPLNALDAVLPDLKAQNAGGLKQNQETIEALAADLVVIQQVYDLKLNGKPVAKPIGTLSRFSSLYSRSFPPLSEEAVSRRGKPPHRAAEEFWQELRQNVAQESRRIRKENS